MTDLVEDVFFTLRTAMTIATWSSVVLNSSDR